MLGGIYTGFMPPSAAGAVGVVGAVAIALLRRRLTARSFASSVESTLGLTAALFLIIIGGALFSRFLLTSGFIGDVNDFLQANAVTPAMFLIMLIALYLVLGMFVDPISIMVMTLPFLFPVSQAMGIDPIWFGVIVVKLVEIAVISPPVGMNLFAVVSASEGEVETKDVFVGILPFIVAEVVCLALIFAFPAIATFLPDSMGMTASARHPRQCDLGGVLHVQPAGRLGARSVANPDRRRDVADLGDAGGQPVGLAHGCEAQRADLVMQPGEGLGDVSVPAALQQQSVERGLRPDHRLARSALTGSDEGVDGGVQSVGEALVRHRGAASSRMGLQESPQLVELHRVLDGDPRDGRASVRRRLDQALGLEMAQRLAHRGAPHAQRLAQLALHEALARREHAGGDGVAELLLDQAAQGGAALLDVQVHPPPPRAPAMRDAGTSGTVSDRLPIIQRGTPPRDPQKENTMDHRPEIDPSEVSESFERGLRTRREVLGDEYVDRSIEAATEYNFPMQQLVTEQCWDGIWNRPGLDRRSRSLLNLGMIAALGRKDELKLHVRGALRNGITKEELREVFMQVAVYCGVPAGIDSFRAAQDVMAEFADP